MGNIREVKAVSGLLASITTERLEFLDEKISIISLNILGGEHGLKNY